MKPIKRVGDTIVRIFNERNDEVIEKVTTKSQWRMNQIAMRLARIKKFEKTGYSYRIDGVAYSSKYNRWTPDHKTNNQYD